MISIAEPLLSSSRTRAQAVFPHSRLALCSHLIAQGEPSQRMLAPLTAASLTLAAPSHTGATRLVPSRLLLGRPSLLAVHAIAPTLAIDTPIQMTDIITIVTTIAAGASRLSKLEEPAESTTSHITVDTPERLSTEVWAGMGAHTEPGTVEGMDMAGIVTILQNLVA